MKRNYCRSLLPPSIIQNTESFQAAASTSIRRAVYHFVSPPQPVVISAQNCVCDNLILVLPRDAGRRCIYTQADYSKGGSMGRIPSPTGKEFPVCDSFSPVKKSADDPDSHQQLNHQSQVDFPYETCSGKEAQKQSERASEVRQTGERQATATAEMQTGR